MSYARGTPAQVTINETPLASFCTIVARAQNTGPWIDNTDLAVPTLAQSRPSCNVATPYDGATPLQGNHEGLDRELYG